MTSQPAIALTPGSFSGTTATLATVDAHGRVPLGPVVPAGSADVAVFPFNVPTAVVRESDRERLVDLVADNATRGLRTIVTISHDHARPVSLGQPDALVLRTSMHASADHAGEHAMPALVLDPWPGEEPQLRPWHERPVVGFMGRAAGDGGRREVAVAAGDQRPGRSGFVVMDPSDEVDVVFPVPIDIGGVLRVRALAALATSALVRPDIVVRDHFYGHYADDERRVMRAAYAEHLRGSDYVLCVRGYGNYSIRLFEAMAMARVPVIVESDGVLPCADVVDWDDVAIHVPLSDLDRVDVHVAAAHAQGPERFADRQRAARDAWVRWLSIEGYARYVTDVLLAEGRH